MNFFQREFTFDRVIRILISLSIIALLVYALSYFSEVLIPFFIALVLAYLLNPFFNLLQRIVKNRVVALFLGFILLTGIVVGFFYLLIPMALEQINNVIEALSNIINNTNWKELVNKNFPDFLSSKIIKTVESGDLSILLSEKQIEELSNFGVNQISVILSVISDFLIGLVGLTFAIIYLFFILLNYNEVQSLGQSLIPPAYRNRVIKVISDFENALNRYFRGQAFIALICVVLYTVGFVVIGLPMGIVLGLITGTLVMIPYMHNLSIIPGVLLAILKSYQIHQPIFTSILFVLIVFAVIQIIMDFVLVPVIMKNATGLNPAIILLSLSLWGKLLGILGLIIALPLTYLFMGYYQDLINETKKTEGPSKPPITEQVTQNLRKIPGED